MKKHPEGLAAPEAVRPDDNEGLFHRPHGKHKAEAFLASLADKDSYRVHRFPDSGGSMTGSAVSEPPPSSSDSLTERSSSRECR